MNFRVDPSNLLAGLANRDLRMKAATKLYGETAGRKLEAYAKMNAPWDDRTGQARQTLEGGSMVVPHGILIYIAGHMDYSVYLEYAMEKRFAILHPTIRAHQTDILEGLFRIINRR